VGRRRRLLEVDIRLGERDLGETQALVGFDSHREVVVLDLPGEDGAGGHGPVITVGRLAGSRNHSPGLGAQRFG
jgi:hypothetical protein